MVLIGGNMHWRHGTLCLSKKEAGMGVREAAKWNANLVDKHV